MPMIYNVIIIGASKEGLGLAKDLSKQNPALKIAIISETLDNIATKYKLDNITYVKGTALDLKYLHGAGVVYLNQTTAYFGENIVVATGEQAIEDPTLVGNFVHYSTQDIITSTPVKMAAVVFGKDYNTINDAIALSRKFKYVYLCDETNKLETLYQKQIFARYDNIAYLPRCTIKQYSLSKQGNLESVELSTYETLNCNAILVSLGTHPDTDKLQSTFIKKDKNGYIIVDSNGLIPGLDNVYAIGKCTKYNKKTTQAVLNMLKNKLK